MRGAFPVAGILLACLGAVALATPCLPLLLKNKRPDPKWTLLAGLLEAGNDHQDGEEGLTAPNSHAR